MRERQLVIAKLDRLARNVAFISNLMESGVEFVAVDMPQANRFVVHILAAVAEQEAEAISKRAKAALAAAKARGTKLGDRRVSAERFAEIGAAARQTRSQEASQSRTELLPTITAITSYWRELAPCDCGGTQCSRNPHASKTWGMVCRAGQKNDGTIYGFGITVIRKRFDFDPEKSKRLKANPEAGHWL
jgi:erythromycin esterase-like protein